MSMREDQKAMERRYSVPYNWLHPEYSMRWVHKEGLLRIVAGMLESGSRVLDVGCGDAWYSARMASRGLEVTGVDVSERAIAFARLIVPDARFEVGSATSLPFPDASFDAITCIQVLEHLTEDEVAAAVNEFARVLRPGGKLVVSVPSARRPLSRAHLRHYTEDSLRETLAPFGVGVSVAGHEGDGRAVRFVRKLMDNRFWLLRRPAKAFYEGWYFRAVSSTGVSRAANLVAIARRP